MLLLFIFLIGLISGSLYNYFKDNDKLIILNKITNYYKSVI